MSTNSEHVEVGGREHPRRGWWTMCLRIEKWMIGLAWSVGLVSGCGPPSLVPPSRSSSAVAEPETAKTIFMVLPVAVEDESEGWAIDGMREANKERVIFRSL